MLQGGDGLAHIVLAAEHAQRLRVQALHAQRDAVDAGGGVLGQAAGLHAGGVGFQCDLDIRQRGEQAAGFGDQACHIVRLHQAGGAAAEEDGTEAARAQPGGLPAQFRQQGGGEAGVVDAVPHMGIEVAIRAF